jgi:outer membrane immunogenic protein
MSRKLLLASAGAIALTGSAPMAADLAPPPVYPPPPPIFTWTGPYLGGQIGYAWVPTTSACSPTTRPISPTAHSTPARAG